MSLLSAVIMRCAESYRATEETSDEARAESPLSSLAALTNVLHSAPFVSRSFVLGFGRSRLGTRRADPVLTGSSTTSIADTRQSSGVNESSPLLDRPSSPAGRSATSPLVSAPNQLCSSSSSDLSTRCTVKDELDRWAGLVQTIQMHT